MNIVTQADWDRLGKQWREMSLSDWINCRCNAIFYRELERQQEIEDTLARIVGLEHGLVLQHAKLGKLRDQE